MRTPRPNTICRDSHRFLSSDVVMVGEREGGGRWERGGREIAMKFCFYKIVSINTGVKCTHLCVYLGTTRMHTHVRIQYNLLDELTYWWHTCDQRETPHFPVSRL